MPGASIRSALISVTDVDRSSEFYRDVLNGTELMRDDQVVTLGCQERSHYLLFLRNATNSPTHPGQEALGLRVLMWDVGSTAELDRVESRLRARGALQGRRTTPDGTAQFVHGHDPDRLPLVFLAYVSERDLPAAHYRDLTELMFRPLDR